METIILKPTAKNIKLCAETLLSGIPVAFPTETVYGLGASAFDEAAVKRIYQAKGRPSDNPLIVHISSKDALSAIVKEIPPPALKLMDALMPGALTLIFKKKDCIPLTVTGGLDTVAVRMPNNKTALKFLSACGVPVAAPSANKSGFPSTTTAKHVYDDLSGAIPYILDGGECEIGLESAVLDVTCEPPRLLRNGGVTIEEIERVIGKIDVYKGGGETVALSPGMKYKHYSPKAEVYFSAYYDKMENTILSLYDRLKSAGKNPVILALEKRIDLYGGRNTINVGKDYKQYAHSLFSSLRLADNLGYDSVIAEGVQNGGIGETIINRLVKSSGGQII